MKKRFLYSCLMIIIYQNNLAQTPSLIQKTVVNGQYSRHTITKLNFLRPDLYNRAVDDQLGIIGNDFWGDQKLPNHKNDNSLGTATDFFTISGYKQTFCGKMILQEFRDPGNEYGVLERDDDLNMRIVCNPKNPVLISNYNKIKNRSYNDYPFPYIEGEIDIDDGFQKYFYNNSGLNFPIPNITNVCLYGPWIEEVYDNDEDVFGNASHLEVHEIHPAEEYWWAEKVGNDFRYYLNAANDASGRFVETGWASNELKNIFAIAFDIPKPGKFKSKISYQITAVCNQNVSPVNNDAKKHYLILGSDTLIEVVEPQDADLLSVSFESVGIDPYSVLKTDPDSIIKGFIVLQSKIENRIQNRILTHGNLKMIIDKKITTNTKSQIFTLSPDIKITPQHGQDRPDRLQDASKTHLVKITLKEISTLENKFSSHGSSGGRFKLRGYIFADKELNNIPFSKSTSQILEGKPQLLFPLSPDTDNNRVIWHNHEIRTSTYNNSINISLNSNEKMTILTDFVASYEMSDYIRTLELIEKKPYEELVIKLSDLKKGQPVVKEIFLHNWERNPNYDPKEYKMKIRIEFLMLD